jgi:hypothetical protein
MKVSYRNIDSETHLVAFLTDPLYSSMHLFCHKGQRAFHGCSVPFNFQHKHCFCFKLNFIYAYTLYNEVEEGGGPRVNFHRLIWNIRTRACADSLWRSNIWHSVFVYGTYRVQVLDPSTAVLAESVCGFSQSLRVNARILLKIGSQPLSSTSFSIQYSVTILYVTETDFLPALYSS